MIMAILILFLIGLIEVARTIRETGVNAVVPFSRKALRGGKQKGTFLILTTML